MAVGKKEKEGVFRTSAGHLISLFLKFSEMKGLSPRTIKYYQDKLERLLQFMEEKSGKNIPDAQEILEFVYHLKERGNSPESVNCYLRAIKVFFRWAQNQGFLDKNPAQGIPFQKVKRTLFPTLTYSEMQKLLDAARKGNCAKRDVAILLLLLDTGIRPGELCNLTLKDLDFRMDLIRVSGKTGERVLPISPATRRALLSYLKEREGEFGEDALFLTEQGQSFNSDMLRHLLARLRKRAKVERAFPYMLRHTAATSYLREGADLETVRMLLGHSTYAVTQRYLSLTHGDLARVQRRASPVNRLK